VTTVPAQTESNSSPLVTQPAGPPQQLGEQRQGLLRHRDRLAVAQESMFGDIDLERSEAPSLNVSGHERND
jgi:hypothetical protein